MKKNLLRIVAGLLIASGVGTGVVINNTTDTDIVFTLPDGRDTTLVAQPLRKHQTKKFPKRDAEKINSIDIHHTATDTLTALQYINNYIVDSKNWEKIPYHFLIDYNGDYYFNNELDVKTYHNSENNTKGIGIALIGNFQGKKSNEDMLCRLDLLVRTLDSVFDIKSINGHRDWKNTACPGDSLYVQLKEWQILRNNKR